MKSETSSCKKTALRKDFGRFWPVWVGYTLFLGLLQIVQSNDDLRYWYAANQGECISVMGVVNGIVALVVAQRLFGDLFNTRMCNGHRDKEWAIAWCTITSTKTCDVGI